MKTQRLRLFLLILGFVSAGVMQPALADKEAPVITLIIDDLGYSKVNGERAVNLPGDVTMAILPHTPYSKHLANLSYKKGKTVMLHAPMTNILDKAPGPGTLTTEMEKAQFMQIFRKALDSVPYVEGVNNHMGSKLTQDTTRMQWVMEEVYKRQLFFVDSRTTAKSVAEKEARKAGIPAISRDIFLDHIRTEEAVNKAFDTMVLKAKHYGNMNAIAHPYTVTMDVLEKRLPELEQQGIKLISVPSQLIAEGRSYANNPQAQMIAELTVAPLETTTSQPRPSAAPKLNQNAAGQLTDKAAADYENRSAAPMKNERVVTLKASDPDSIISIGGSRSKSSANPDALTKNDDYSPEQKPFIFQQVKEPNVMDLPPVQNWTVPVKEH
ncbi:divergent polysaccharide deacetylase family protein [Oceanospirillum beijerinckii]|uniref:divergent polysaccharide deacetylase family protein n=1 Tax=Oceanospirillum beijerinckii TaxID=64976 RepID=UPI000421A2F6|nr:divergent polysaccharide deacetylase family protein [Oceanospirillum beijerinckii]